MNNSYLALLNEGGFSQLNTGSALASSTSLTDISAGGNTAGQALTFPANYLQIGQQYLIKANGIVSNTGTPTLLLGLYYGAAAGTALATTGAATTASTLSNTTWELEALLRVDAVGTSGSIRTIGHVFGPYAAYTMIPASSSSGNNVTVDTSSSKLLSIAAQWGTSSASNTIQLMQFTAIRLNEGSS